MTGLSAMGTSGFGKTVVSGRSRVPSPPARIAAVTSAQVGGASTEADAGDSDDIFLDLVAGETALQICDGPLEPCVQRDAWTPAEHRAGLRVVADQSIDLAGGGPEATLVGAHAQAPAEQLSDDVHQLRDRHALARSQVDCLTDAFARPGRGDEAIGGVGHIGEVAYRRRAAEADLVARECLRDDRRDDGPRALTRAVGVERAHDARGEPEAVPVALDHLVGGDLRRRIR